MPGDDPREPFARISVSEGREMMSRDDAVGQRSPLVCEMAAAAGLTRLFNAEFRRAMA